MQYVLKRRIHLKNLLSCYETVGSPTISNGVVSGFSDGNYVRLKRDVSSCDNTEYVIKFTTSSTTSSVVQSIFHWEFVVTFEMRPDSFTVYTYNWETAGSTDLTTLSANTTYWLKVVLNGNTKSIYLSTDGVDYTQLISFSENGLRPLEYLPSLGDHVTIDRPFIGTIDLNESSVKFNKTYYLKSNEKTYVLEVNPDNQTSDETVYYTFTINPTPENAIVTINGKVTNSVTLAEGRGVTWSVTADGYVERNGVAVLNENIILDVELEAYKYYTLTINPTPSDATVTINGEVTNSVTVNEGTILNWEVSDEGYITQSSSITMVEDVTINVELELQSYTFTINPTPSNATVKLNGQTTKTLTVVHGTTVNWEVSASGYITQSGTVTVTSNSTKNVVLKKKELLYACYSEAIGDDTQYLYAKTPLGSDLIKYVSSAGSYVLAETSSSLVAIDARVPWTSVNENQAVYKILVTSTCPRYKAGDLYE